MSEELQPNQQAIKKAIFLSWMTEFEGKYWCDPKKMPPGVPDPLYTYYHFRRNFSPNDHRALEAAKEFQDITGYSAEDFYKFREDLNKGK